MPAAAVKAPHEGAGAPASAAVVVGDVDSPAEASKALHQVEGADVVEAPVEEADVVMASQAEHSLADDVAPSICITDADGLVSARSASKSSAGPFDVDVLLGHWVRDGGRTHAVHSTAGEGAEFLPGGGRSPKPILKSAGTWCLSGYVLDESRSTKQVLRWQHTDSRAVRTWWRPGCEGPSNEMLSPERTLAQPPSACK